MGVKPWYIKKRIIPKKAPEVPRPKKARQVQLNAMVLPAVFLDWHNIIHYKFLPSGLAVNMEYCFKVLHHLYGAKRRKQSELCQQLDFVPWWQCTVSQFTTNMWFFMKTTLSQCCSYWYSPPPDVGPCDFFLLLIRMTFKACFVIPEDIRQNRECAEGYYTKQYVQQMFCELERMFT